MTKLDKVMNWNFHSCKLCSYRSNSTFVICRHAKFHERRPKRDKFSCGSKTPELFECESCEFKSNLKVDLTEHLRVYHDGKEDNEEIDKIFKCLHCKNCDFETHSVLVLTQHVNTCIAVFRNNSSKEREKLEVCSVENDQSCEFISSGSSESELPMDQTEINSVQYILQNAPVPYDQKLLIKQKGKPTPDLLIKTVTVNQSRIYTKMFNRNIYDKYEWICGCPVVNKLFCFVCLLFRRKMSSWTQDGVNDLKHLLEGAKKHQSSLNHLNAFIDFGVLGKIDISGQQGSTYLRNKVKHNEKVDKNRYILRRLIMCIRCCGAFELALRESSDNPGVYIGLTNFTAELDAALAMHLNEATLFKGTITIQNELLDAMLAVYRAEVIKQIKSANFMALEADETTDISNHQHMVVIFRYVINGQICERFWSFIRTAGHTAAELAELLLVELQVFSLSDNSKLIAQSYDGASVMSGRNNGVQAVIRETFPFAYFIHCYAHQFNLILEQAAQCHKNVKIFFANLQSFSRFFSRSSEHISVLDEVVKKRIPPSVPPAWNFKSRTVSILFEYKDSIIDCLEKIIDTLGVSSKTISEACGLLNNLKSSEFLYWLKVFRFIVPHVELLFNQAQAYEIGGLQLQKAVEQFEQNIINVRNSIDHMKDEEEPARKRQNILDSKSVVAKQVCDNILILIRERFHFKDHLSAAKLFDFKSFKSYREFFPDNQLNATVKSYSMLNGAQLRSELIVIYQRNDMCTLNGILSLLVFLTDNNFQTVFSETYKLLDIICTTPMSTSESERCFATLKRIKTFLRSTVSEDRLNALAVLSIEKTFIQGIADFDNKVIDIFCSAKHRMDFMYQ